MNVLYRSEAGVVFYATNACRGWDPVALPPIDRFAALAHDPVGRHIVGYFDPDGVLQVATLQETFEP